jgi:nicotinate-nucleotide adenylyltransferase
MFKEEINLLFSIVEEELNLVRDEIISTSRKSEIVDARRIVAAICKKNSKLSLEKIGLQLGGRDHATILSALKRHSSLYESDKYYIKKFDNINYKFLSSSVVSKKISSSIKELNYKKENILNQIEKEILKLKSSSNIEKRKKNLNIGLFMGTFNPLHNGHMMIANTAIYSCNFDEVWFVVASESPDKIKDNNVISFKNRIEIVKKCTINNPLLKVCDIEGSLPKPSYTYNTLFELRKKYSEYKFSIIMGSDNIANIEGWKNCKSIIKNHEIFYYERPNIKSNLINSFGAKEIEGVSKIDISSTKIRSIIESGKALEVLRYLIPNECLYLIEKNNHYKNEKKHTNT